MEIFPFTQAEWQRVQDASHSVLNATLADDDVLRDSNFGELVAVLDELRDRYGDHPILRETEADFQDDPSSRLEAYRSAILSAEQHELPTFTIRISLARVLLEEFLDPGEAMKELTACQSEVLHNADEYEKNQYQEIVGECERHLRGE